MHICNLNLRRQRWKDHKREDSLGTMFTAVLLTIAKPRLQDSHTMKRNEVLSHATIQMNLKTLCLVKEEKSQKASYYMTLFMLNV